MNHSNSNRRDAGKATPIPCPDCGVSAVLTDGHFLMTGHPCVPHSPTCPTHRAVTEQLCADLDWLADHPNEETCIRRRPLTGAECAEMHVALGRRVPRSQRHRWEVWITPFCRGRRSGVARAYVFDGRIVAVALIAPDQAVAL